LCQESTADAPGIFDVATCDFLVWRRVTTF